MKLQPLTPAQVAEAQKQVRVARNRLALRFPFFGSLAFGLNYEMVDPSDDFITTAATDGETIYWHPGFSLALKDDSSRMFVQAHEIMHVVTWTMKRCGSRDPGLWNMATDFAINAALVKSGFSMPQIPDWELEGEMRVIGLYDEKYAGMLPEEIYELLVKEGKKATGTLDKHLTGKLTKNAAGKIVSIPRTSSATDELGIRIRGLVAAAAMAAGADDNPLIKRLLKEASEPRLNWREILTSTLLTLKSADYEWNPPDKTFFGNGITIPSLAQETSIKAALVIDVSGSITDGDLNNVFAEVVGISEQFTDWEIMVVSFDHMLHNPRVYTEIEELRAHQTEGGGGTAFKTFLSYLAGETPHEGKHCEFQPDVVVVFTDGYTGDGWHPEYKDMFDVLWLINNTEVRPPWGQYVKYDPYS